MGFTGVKLYPGDKVKVVATDHKTFKENEVVTLLGVTRNQSRDGGWPAQSSDGVQGTVLPYSDLEMRKGIPKPFRSCASPKARRKARSRNVSLKNNPKELTPTVV